MHIQHHWYFDKANNLYYHHQLTAVSVTDADFRYADELKSNKRLLEKSDEAYREITLTIDPKRHAQPTVTDKPAGEPYFLYACRKLKLSVKQTNVILLARTYKTYEEIAAKAFSSANTVRNHLHAVYIKVKASGMDDALYKLNEYARYLESH